MLMNEFEKACDTLGKFMAYMLEKDMKSWTELWDENAVFEFPYAPEGSPKRIEGKAAIYDYIKDYPDQIHLSSFTAPTVYRSADTNTIIAEFQCDGHVIETGLPYRQSYISVIETRDGRIVRYKDYWNPLVVKEAFGGSFLQTEESGK
ncbi:nuclear transport factor 2 family protein [Bacillus inaquosorum]|uniref:nuclear transport factor 2 family protein n=1 Tax=Bacillus inaquosorum TaxID=483913 RepID=UPI003D20BF75